MTPSPCEFFHSAEFMLQPNGAWLTSKQVVQDSSWLGGCGHSECECDPDPFGNKTGLFISLAETLAQSKHGKPYLSRPF